MIYKCTCHFRYHKANWNWRGLDAWLNITTVGIFNLYMLVRKNIAAVLMQPSRFRIFRTLVAPLSVDSAHQNIWTTRRSRRNSRCENNFWHKCYQKNNTNTYDWGATSGTRTPSGMSIPCTVWIQMRLCLWRSRTSLKGAMEDLGTFKLDNIRSKERQ
jgi:hypothetical protein